MFAFLMGVVSQSAFLCGPNPKSPVNRGPVRTTVRKPQETGPIGGGQMPIAPTVDADTFHELAQRPTTSTVVVLDGDPEGGSNFETRWN